MFDCPQRIRYSIWPKCSLFSYRGRCELMRPIFDGFFFQFLRRTSRRHGHSLPSHTNSTYIPTIPNSLMMNTLNSDRTDEKKNVEKRTGTCARRTEIGEWQPSPVGMNFWNDIWLIEFCCGCGDYNENDKGERSRMFGIAAGMFSVELHRFWLTSMCVECWLWTLSALNYSWWNWFSEKVAIRLTGSCSIRLDLMYREWRVKGAKFFGKIFHFALTCIECTISI